MAQAAEEVGFDSIWLGDHLLYRDGDDGRDRGPWDAWTLMAALAAARSACSSARWWPARRFIRLA